MTHPERSTIPRSFPSPRRRPDTPDTPTAGRVTVTVPVAGPARRKRQARRGRGIPAGPVRNHYTLTFNAHTVSDRDNKTVMDVLAYYKYQFVKANANVNESGFAESEKDDNVTDLSGSAETGIGFSLKDPAADNAVYLKLYIDGDNASRTRGGAVVYKVPLAVLEHRAPAGARLDRRRGQAGRQLYGLGEPVQTGPHAGRGGKSDRDGPFQAGVSGFEGFHQPYRLHGKGPRLRKGHRDHQRAALQSSLRRPL